MQDGEEPRANRATADPIHAPVSQYGTTAVAAADSGVYEMEVSFPDGHGGMRKLTVNGRAERAPLVRCLFHFIAHGICVDCSRAAGRQVWAS